MVTNPRLQDPNYWFALSSTLGNMSRLPLGTAGDIGAPMQAYQQQAQAQQQQTQAQLAAQAQKNQTLQYLQGDPDLMKAVEIGAMTPAEAVNTAYKQKLEAAKPASYEVLKGEDGSINQYNPRDPKGTFTTIRGPAVNPKDAASQKNEAFKTELDTMKAYRSEDDVKTYQATRDGYEKVRTSASLDSAQGDMGLVYGFMKMLDPTSVVREGEFATAEQAGGIPDTVVNLYNKAWSGERLTPQQREQFVRAAEAQYGNTVKNLEAVNTRYGGLANEYGVPTDRFVEKPKAYEPLKIGGPAAKVVTPTGPVEIERFK